MNEYKLKNKWTLWYHSLKDNNWLISSYNNLLQMFSNKMNIFNLSVKP